MDAAPETRYTLQPSGDSLPRYASDPGKVQEDRRMSMILDRPREPRGTFAYILTTHCHDWQCRCRQYRAAHQEHQGRVWRGTGQPYIPAIIASRASLPSTPPRIDHPKTVQEADQGVGHY
ncbi:hypothetical protein L226DRAFT_91483 [Lentinus tigrinus ALCF2SS1-7]|uniref:uncharacterized protein n=1 Tax=Lentinus tigrinus ALCF2SS1-7 TaxID=1328758 RepID=UPI0011662096|nr:hypothetical protein L226DRAFT_91483 [Lentinus tigrinus ALCF2SS1-7]